MTRPELGSVVPQANFKRLGVSGIEDVSSHDLFSNRDVLLIGVVGAFTPVCTTRHLPEFIPYQEELTQAGLVDEVVCVSVADPFTLKAWAKSLDIDSRMTMLTDTNAEFARSMDLAVDLSGMGLGWRSTRYVLFVRDGIIEILNVEVNPGDVDVTSAESIQKLLAVRGKAV